MRQKSKKLTDTYGNAANENAIRIDCNETLFNLLGPQDRNIAPIEQRYNVKLICHQNGISFSGKKNNINKALEIVSKLTPHAEQRALNPEDVRQIIDNHLLPESVQQDKSLVIKTPNAVLKPRSENQTDFLEKVKKHEMMWVSGPAGSGKTFLAIAAGVEALMNGEVEHLVLSRPAIGSESLGFKPGTTQEKVAEYMTAMLEALGELLPKEDLNKALLTNKITIEPFDTLRGRNIKESFVVLDEGQNTEPKQMEMFTNRMSEGSRYVIVGDPTQADKPICYLNENGLEYALRIYKDIKEMAFVTYTSADVVRHPLVQKMVEAQEKEATRSAKQKAAPNTPTQLPNASMG